MSDIFPTPEAVDAMVARSDEILASTPGPFTPFPVSLVKNLPICKNCPNRIAVTFIPTNGKCDPFAYNFDICAPCAKQLLDENECRVRQGQPSRLSRQLPVIDPCGWLCGNPSSDATNAKCMDCRKKKECECGRGPIQGKYSICIECITESKCSNDPCEDHCCALAARNGLKLCEGHYKDVSKKHFENRSRKRKAELDAAKASFTTKSGEIRKQRVDFTPAEERAIAIMCAKQWTLKGDRYHRPKQYNWPAIKVHQDVDSNREFTTLGRKAKAVLMNYGIDSKTGHPKEKFENFLREMEEE